MITSVSLPENVEIYIDAFIVEQSAKNCEITLSRKRKTLTSFALYLSEHGVNDFTELDVTILSFVIKNLADCDFGLLNFFRY